MLLKFRPLQSEEDIWRVRAFLRQLLVLNGYRERSWDIARFDYWRCFGTRDIEPMRLEEVVGLWELPDGSLGAVMTPEGWNEAFFHVLPELRSPELEEELIDTAEQTLCRPDQAGGRRFKVWANPGDDLRTDALRRRGYVKGEWPEYQRRRPMHLPIPEPPLPPGFAIRPVGEGAELLERAYASGLAFHTDDIMVAVRNREDINWYRHIQSAPLYRRDLDLTVTAPDGAVASFCTVWYDDVTRCGVFEPVATVPAYWKRGLGKAVMCEGLRRLKQLGALWAFVGSYSVPAGALYASAGFTDYELLEPWERNL